MDTIFVDTAASIIRVTRDQIVESFPYELHRKRWWNIGLRRHVNELTGAVIVYTPTMNAYRVCGGFDQAKAWAMENFARYHAE